jgi:hypothetical protein
MGKIGRWVQFIDTAVRSTSLAGHRNMASPPSGTKVKFSNRMIPETHWDTHSSPGTVVKAEGSGVVEAVPIGGIIIGGGVPGGIPLPVGGGGIPVGMGGGVPAGLVGILPPPVLAPPRMMGFKSRYIRASELLSIFTSPTPAPEEKLPSNTYSGAP